MNILMCILYNAGASWDNITMDFLGGDLYGYNFTIPTDDAYLGQIEIIMRANDTDDGWTEISFGTVTVLNNQFKMNREEKCRKNILHL